MMAKTNRGLADYVKKAYNAKWVYWYGTTGVRCTGDLLNRKTAQYPKEYTASRMPQYRQNIADGKMCADCINLAKGYVWLDEATGKQIYGKGCQDKSADGMFGLATIKGKIKDMPEIEGTMVRYAGHAGVYIGNGWVIEARGFKHGVVMTRLSERPWTDWYFMPGVDYSDMSAAPVAPANPAATPCNPYAEPSTNQKYGNKGEGVKWIQWHLQRLGYDLGKWGVDGDWGKCTEEAVLVFQQSAELEVDGIVGKLTRAALKTA